MRLFFERTSLLGLVLGLSLGAVQAADAPAGLDQFGKPELKSAGPLAFGPAGVLFVGDPQGAAIFALDIGSAPQAAITGDFKFAGLDGKVAGLLGTTASDISIQDVAVDPTSKIAYLSVARGKGPAAQPVLVRVDGAGALSAVPVEKIHFAKLNLNDAPPAEAKDRRGNSLRQESITDLGFVDGRLFIAGLSNEEFASKLRAVTFPFQAPDVSTSVEIYHGAHGAFETRAPVRTFVPFKVGGEPHLLAAYTCTPLVTFPLSDLKAGAKLRGTTVAELGNRNRPLDIIAYDKGNQQYLLLANSARGVMKIPTSNLEKQAGITEKVADKAGLGYETIANLTGVEHLDKLDGEHALLLVRADGALTLQAVDLP